MMRSLVRIAAAQVGVLLLFVGAPLLAQNPISISVEPRAGLLSPGGHLYRKNTDFNYFGPSDWTDGYLGRALVLGAGFEVGRTQGGVLLRGEVLRSFDQALSIGHSIVVATPDNLQFVKTTRQDTRVNLTSASLQLVVPTRVALWRVQPYVLGGVTGEHYHFALPTQPSDSLAILPHDRLTWGGQLGAGVTLPVRGLVLDLQVRESISSYWGMKQANLVATSGLLWRVR